MLDHVAKRQKEIKENIVKSFMADGGADVTNGVEKAEDNVAPPGSVIKEATEKGEASGFEVDKEMEEEDKKKDKTEMKKSEDNIDFLSSGGFLKSQSNRMLSCYGIASEQLAVIQTPEVQDMEKGKKGGGHPIGTKKDFGGRPYIKTASGWKYNPKGKKTGTEDDKKHNGGSSTDKEYLVKRAAELTDAQLSSHYTSEMPLKTSDTRSLYFKALHQELLKREKDPKSKFYVGKVSETEDKESTPEHAEHIDNYMKKLPEYKVLIKDGVSHGNAVSKLMNKHGAAAIEYANKKVK